VIKIIGIFLLVVFALVIIFLALFMWSLDNHLERGCVEIESIARDKDAVSYMDSWVSDHVLDRGYTFVRGSHSSISARLNGEYIEINPLPDESKSRIRTNSLRFDIDTLKDDLDIPVTKSNVSKIYFGLGRNYVILLKNGATLSSYRDRDEKSGHLKKINETIYAYCEDAKFKM